MMVPRDDDPIDEPDPQTSEESLMENLGMDTETEQAAAQANPEVDEVQNLQELVRGLEIQNQQLIPEKPLNEQRQITSDTGNQDVEPNSGEKRGFSREVEKQSQLGEINPKIKESKSFKGNMSMQLQASSTSSWEELAYSPEQVRPKSSTDRPITIGGSIARVDMSTRPKIKASKMAKQISSTEIESFSSCPDTLLSTLDDVELLELDDLTEGDDSNWLYSVPKRGPPVEQKTESLLKWCRQVLDHPSPETKAACTAFLKKLDQASRWKTLCRSTLTPSGVQSSNIEPDFSINIKSIPEALKSASEPVLPFGTPELSGISASQLTSKENIDYPFDEFILKGLKLQDVTDVQAVHPQEESLLLQEHSSASASAPCKIPRTSFQALRGRVCSYQELDHARGEEDYDHPRAFSGIPRYSSSLPILSRCHSPSTRGDYGKAIPARMILPKRSVSSSRQECKKWSSSEDELYPNMPSEIRSSLRSLSSMRSSHGLDLDVQAPKTQLSRLQKSVGLVPSKIRFSANIGKPLLNIRKPMKAEPNVVLNPRQPIKPEYSNPIAVDQKPEAHISPGPMRRYLSPASIASVATIPKCSSAKERGPGAEKSPPKTKLMEPSSRSLQPRKPGDISDEI